MELNHEELSILLSCIYACKFDGKDVVQVGILTDKIIKELQRQQTTQKKKQNG